MSKFTASPYISDLLQAANKAAAKNLLDIGHDSPTKTTVIGNGVLTTFAISGASDLTNPNTLIVAIDGVMQEPGVDYTVSDSNITFTDPLPSGAKAVIVINSSVSQITEGVPSDGSVTSSKLAPNLTIVNPTLSGTATFSGSARPTAPNVTGTPVASSLITRSDADARFGEFLISDLVSDATPIQSQTTFQNTGCEVTLGVGTWLVQAQTHATNANAAAQFQFRGTLSGGIELFGVAHWGFGNTGSPSQDNQVFFTGVRGLGNGTRGYWRAEGLIRVTTSTVTVRTQYAQAVSTAADTQLRAGTHIIARRLKP